MGKIIGPISPIPPDIPFSFSFFFFLFFFFSCHLIRLHARDPPPGFNTFDTDDALNAQLPTTDVFFKCNTSK